MAEDFKEHDKLLAKIMGEDKPKINAVEKADQIMERHELIFCAGEFYEYKGGYYQTINELHICAWAKLILKKAFTKTRSNEIIHCIKTDTFLDIRRLNGTDLLNVRNGMLDVNTFELKAHDKEYYSTIRLDVNYDDNERCDKWESVVLDMFEGDTCKVQALQEYFGLCLTKSTEYEKALFMVGEGRNGKSVVLYVLCELLGRDNYSAVSLDMFEKSHCVAGLFGKLANVSIETNAKSSVYDSIFKAIVSGDAIEADRKYRDSFVFRPFCKLIFATNNLPRVNDKTAAFFKRLLILKFNKQYTEAEQDKRLKYDLVEHELSGIFMWALRGLKRLKTRGHFEVDMNMYNDVLTYQQENNNVLVFVDERCEFDVGGEAYIKELYETYKGWCDSDGYRAVSKRNFVKEICKHYKNVTRDRSKKGRKLCGIYLFVRGGF